MSNDDDLVTFLRYAQAFELAWLSDDWSGVADCFTDDAEYVVHDGGPFGGGGTGRDGVVAALRDSTRGVDRRFDVRIPEILAGPVRRADGVWVRYALELRRAGLPELRFTGTSVATVTGGRIRRLLDTPEPGTGMRAAAFVVEHDARLRPAGAPLATELATHDVRDLEHAVQRSLVRCYGAAKSQQDVEAALAICSDDFVLDTPAFGTTARGKEEARAQLGLFFTAFPDYRVELEGIAADGRSVACWGTAHLTFAGPLLELRPTGRTATLPFASIFACDPSAVRAERFHVDLATLCAQIGVPLPEMTAVLGLPADAGASASAVRAPGAVAAAGGA